MTSSDKKPYDQMMPRCKQFKRNTPDSEMAAPCVWPFPTVKVTPVVSYTLLLVLGFLYQLGLGLRIRVSARVRVGFEV